MKVGQVAKSIKCDSVEVAVGMSGVGLKAVLMTPQLRGKPLLKGPISLTPDHARRLAALLIQRAEQAEQRLN